MRTPPLAALRFNKVTDAAVPTGRGSTHQRRDRKSVV